VAPLHPAPVNDQASAPVGFEPGTGIKVATIPADVPTGTLAGAESCRVKLLVIVIAADACLDGSARLCAVNVAAAGDGKIRGAVKVPFASTAPHPAGHAAPESVQRTASLGWPLLLIRGRKPFVAPSSTAAVVLSAICRSLAMVTWDAPDFVMSARLVAAIFKIAGTGKFAGPVYMPVAEIIPSAPLPPSTPFTVQTTVVSLAFVTVAVNFCVFPRITVALEGVTVTATVPGGVGEGAGLGVTSPVPRLEQPCSPSNPSARSGSARRRVRADFFLGKSLGSACGKRRMPVGMQANNQRKRVRWQTTNFRRRFRPLALQPAFC
jgi:hypothetical protein